MITTWFEEYLKSWNSLDVDSVLRFFTDDAHYEATTINHTANGKEELRHFVQSSFDNVPAARFEFVDGVDDGTTYAIQWVMHPMGVPGVSFGSLRDGKISENRDYWNGRLFDVPNV